jgi:negative regulator of sigma E activity
MTRDRLPPAQSPTPAGDELETLSALFDDALDAEAARFARRRLAHDPIWQARLSRWQLLGDVLRGERVLAVDDEFAARVQAVLRGADTLAARTTLTPTPPLRRWPWLGGAALAASVALVALLAWPEAPAPMPDRAAAGSGSPRPATTAATSASVSTPAPVTPAPAGTASAPREVVMARETRASSPAVVRDRAAPTPARPTMQVAATADAHVAMATPMHAPIAADPFGLQNRAIPSRPWPRDRFGPGGNGALTAAYEFTQPAPASDDPFRAGEPALRVHPAEPAPLEARPVSHDAPP